MAQSKVFSGVMWAATQRFGTMAISFVTNIVLARLLTNLDYGTIGELAFFVMVANVFVDSGFGSALIQKKNLTEADCSTVFYTNSAISVICYLVLFFGAPWVAGFYKVEILAPLLRVEGLILITNALAIIQTSIMRREMNFRRLASANLAANIGAAVLSIGFALAGAGVWALVVRALSISGFTALALWYVSPWRPKWLFSWKSLKELFSFGGYMLSATLLNTIAANLQSLIIGKIWNRGILGYYTQAMQLRTVAADSISSVIGQVLYPDYTNHQADNATILQKVNFGIYIISYVTVALMMLMACTAQPLFHILFGEKWLPAVPYFQVLCVGGIFYCVQDVNYYVVAAKGRSRTLFLINLVKIPVYIVCLVVIGKYCGFMALLWTIVVYTFVSYLLFSFYATRLLRSNILRQAINIAKSMALSVVPLCLAFMAGRPMTLYPPVATFLMQTVVFIGSFAAISYFTKPEPFVYLVRKFLKREL